MADLPVVIDALAFAEKNRHGFQVKADHNKTESLSMFILVIVATLITPLFVTLGDGLWLGKVIPSVLSLIAAGSTAWLQLRKPQSLWSLYRDCQRRIEKHVTKYNYCLDEYDCPEEERNKLLAKVVCDVAWDAHEKWLPLIPTPEAIGAIPGKRVLLEHERPNGA